VSLTDSSNERIVMKERSPRMAKTEDLGEVISTDVMIVGGGIGGLVAAIKAKEESPKLNVLLLDKQTVGWAGKTPKGAGGIWLMTPEDDLDEFVEYHVRNIGCYLNDQELLLSFGRETYGAMEQLEGWGVNVPRNAEGKLDTVKWLSPKWSFTVLDLDMMFPLRERARKLGVNILDKVQVVEILNQDDRVVGAVGFNIFDGRFFIFQAKATLLANGGCNYRVMRMWASGCGDGIAAAYRAGAEMRNAEFGNFYDVVWKDTSSAAYLGQNFLYNGAGESISKRYMPEPLPDIPIAIALGMEREVSEGRGPLTVDMSQLVNRYKQIPFQQGRPHLHAFHGRSQAKLLKYGPPPTPRPEVTLGFHGEFSPIKVDHDMKTSLPGLWAIGDASWAGSGWQGAIPPPGGIRGSGLMNAVLAALRGGPSSARFASQKTATGTNYAEVKRLKKDLFSPMKREKGILPVDVIYAIQDVVSPIKYNLRRSKERLEEALSKIEEVQERLPELCAKDGHGLGKCHEAKAMAVCAEMNFRSALMRTESRGWHYREDYPDRDDRNWLKWVIIKQEAGKMALSTEPIPIDRYKVKPLKGSGG
jgi:succinate dehydrogenase / fumarate reductase flavoprotein subunit